MSFEGKAPCTTRMVIRITQLAWGPSGGQDRLPCGKVFVQISEGKDVEKDI